jgi:hypothetical protein
VCISHFVIVDHLRDFATKVSRSVGRFWFSADDNTPVHLVVDRALVYTNTSVDFNQIDAPPIDFEAFRMDKGGTGGTRNFAVCQAQWRAKQKIIAAVKDAGNEQQQALTLDTALVHPEISKVSKTAGFHSKITKAVGYQWQQIVDILQAVMGKERKKLQQRKECICCHTLDCSSTQYAFYGFLTRMLPSHTQSFPTMQTARSTLTRT